MISLTDLPSAKDMCDLTYKMWKKGWDEANGGNISCLLDPEEADCLIKYKDDQVQHYPMHNIPESIRNRYFLVTSTGSFFQYIQEQPEELLGVVHIPTRGDCYEIVAGYTKGGRPTSEFESHARSHATRLEVNPSHHVIMHNHAEAVLSMTHCGPINERDFTVALWRIITEAIMLFPDGIGFLPWEMAGTETLGIDTAKKMRNHRIVVWQYHGVLTAGNDMRDAFGLLETVEKCAEVYVHAHACGTLNPGISDENLAEIARMTSVSPVKGYIPGL